MRNKSSKIVIITGFSLILLLLGFISLLAIYNISGNSRSLDEIVAHQEKMSEVFTMRGIAHQRVLLLYTMAFTDDAFERDDLYLLYLDHADAFMKARDRFRSHTEDDFVYNEYVDAWEPISSPVSHSAELQNSTVTLILNNQIEQARVLLHEEVGPAQKVVIAAYNKLLETHYALIAEKLKTAQNINQKYLLLIIILGVTALLTGILIALYVTRYNAAIESDLIEQHLAAQEASKEKSYFLANMSHEIRTPLASIIGFSEALLSDDQDAKQYKQTTETIVRNGKHLQQIINDILDISKIEAGQLATEHIATSPILILAEIDSLLASKAKEKGLEFNIKYHFPLPVTILTDPTRLKQILINLCSNAIKFTQYGQIKIDVSYDEVNRQMKFIVMDTGIGMTDKEAAHVFNPFAQADSSTTRRYGGTGLGLSISSKLADELKGKLTCHSDRGKGSTFTLSLAVDKTDELVFIKRLEDVSNYIDEQTQQVEIKQLDGNILLAEDILDNQQLIAMYINRTGAKLSIVENGQQAVDAGKANEYDLILMDMQMPVMDGVEATRLLRSNGYSKPIVCLTANVMVTDREKCIAAGADEYLVKPLNLQRFYEVLNKCLAEADNTTAQTVTDSGSVQDFLKNSPNYQALVVRFLDSLPDMTQEITQSVFDKQWENAQSKSHDLKGMGGTMGYPEITEVSGKLNTQIKQNEYDSAAATCEELESLLMQIAQSRTGTH
ncbi:MAG: response regulator [Gammaproteobacteria bacterium]|nr:response regulator [Gammaproteobacteria bacterium]